MADKTVSFELLIDASKSAKSLGDLKKSIRDLKSAALEAEAAGDNNLANKLAESAAKATDRISDLNKKIQATQDLGSKIGAFAQLGTTIASGFQAATGAAALFGSQGKELEKVLLKVQAASAFAQGLQGISEAGKQLSLVGSIVKGPVVAAFTSLRGALIATGIGALVAVVGLLYANFDKVKQVLANIIPESVQKAFGYLKDAIGGAVDKLKDWAGLNEKVIVHTPKIFKIYDDNLKQVKKSNEDFRKSVDETNEKLKAHQEWLNKLSESGAPGSIGYYNFLLGESTTRLNKLVPGSSEYNKELQKQLDLTEKLNIAQAQAEASAFAQTVEGKFLAKKKAEGITPETFDANESVVFPDLPAVTQKNAENTQLLQLDIDYSTASFAQLKRFEESKTYLATLSAEQREKLDKAYADRKLKREKTLIDTSKNGLSILSSLGEIFIKNEAKKEKFAKKVAATQLLIDTASGISSVVREASKLGFPAAIPVIVGGVAMVLANIAKAKAILGKAGDTPAVSLDSGGGSVSGAPSAEPPALNTPTTNLNQPNNNTPPPSQPVLVVETYQNAAHRVNVIEQRARFG